MDADRGLFVQTQRKREACDYEKNSRSNINTSAPFELTPLSLFRITALFAESCSLRDVKFTQNIVTTGIKNWREGGSFYTVFSSIHGAPTCVQYNTTPHIGWLWGHPPLLQVVLLSSNRRKTNLNDKQASPPSLATRKVVPTHAIQGGKEGNSSLGDGARGLGCGGGGKGDPIAIYIERPFVWIKTKREGGGGEERGKGGIPFLDGGRLSPWKRKPVPRTGLGHNTGLFFFVATSTQNST